MLPEEVLHTRRLGAVEKPVAEIADLHDRHPLPSTRRANAWNDGNIPWMSSTRNTFPMPAKSIIHASVDDHAGAIDSQPGIWPGSEPLSCPSRVISRAFGAEQHERAF